MIPSRMREAIFQFVVFAVLGSIGTSVHFALLWALVYFWGISPIIGSIMGFLVGACVNYPLNYVVTFHSKRNHLEAMTMFFVVAIVGLGVNACSMLILTAYGGFHYLANQIISTVMVLFCNFAGNKCWTFRHCSAE
ncbi:MAG: GtrA family protein [Syntrophobacteraceae bacterium]